MSFLRQLFCVHNFKDEWVSDTMAGNELWCKRCIKCSKQGKPYLTHRGTWR